MSAHAMDSATDELVISSGSVNPASPLPRDASAADNLVIAPASLEIVFIDDSLADYQTLAASMGVGRQVVILDSTRDGLAQIAEALQGRSGVGALHIVSHGAEGILQLGDLTLDQGSLDARSADLQAIGSSMTADGDILLYGCDVGAGQGDLFVRQLAATTGADVAASDNLTGSAAQGGDWNLEITSGHVETAVAADAQLAALYAHALNIASATIGFDNTGNFASFGNSYLPTPDVIYHVNGDPAYSLLMNGATAGVVAYTFYAGQVFASPYSGMSGGDSSVTFSFQSGQLFTPGTISLGNWDNWTSSPQTLLLKGYDRNNQQVGGPVSTQLPYQPYSSTPVALPGMTDIATLKITALSNGGKIHYLAIDSLSMTNVRLVAPTVTSVTSSATDGTYKAGDTISIAVTFDTAVEVTGTPQLTLETGSVDRAANYVGYVGGSNTLRFTYTVQAGDSSPHLDYVGTTALSLNGGTIKALTAAVDASLTLPAPSGVGSLGTSTAIVIDAVAPAAPAAPDLSAASDSGTSSSDDITSNITPTIGGAAGSVESGATVRLYDTDGVTLLATTTAAGDGRWSAVTAPLSNGAHAITARATDAAGNLSAASSALSVTIDTTAPTLTISSDKSMLKAGETATITITFSEDPGTTFAVDDLTVSGGTLGALSGSGLTRSAIFTPTVGLNSGVASITVAGGAYADTAGNNGGAGTTPSIGFDTLAPSAPSAPTLASASDTGLSSGDGLTRVTTPTFAGSAEAGATVTLYDTDGTTVLGSAVASDGTWSIVSSALGDGTHTVTARATDAAGNLGAASGALSVTIDTSAPAAPGMPVLAAASNSGSSSSDRLTNVVTPTFSGIAEANSRVTLYDTDGTSVLGFVQADADGAWTISASPMGDGQHSLTVKATDAAGNSSAASAVLPLTIDTSALPPSTPDLLAASDTGASDSDDITASTTPTFIGSAENGATVTLYDGAGVIGSGSVSGFGSIGGWRITSTALANGSHSISAVVTDAAGNVSAPSVPLNLLIDTNTPTTTVASAALSADTGPSGSDFVTNTAAQSISGTLSANLAAGEIVQVSLDNGATWNTASTAAGSATWALAATLTSASGTFAVRVMNAAGNAGESFTQAYSLDTTAPSVAITSDKSTLKAGESATITFSFSEDPGTTFTADDLTVSGGTLGALSGSGLTRSADFIPTAGLNAGVASITLAGGAYTDTAGNNGGAGTTPSISFDTLAPSAPSAPTLASASDTGLSNSDGITSVTTPSFAGTAEAGATVTLYDTDGTTVLGSTVAIGGAWSIVSSALDDGTHTVTARATDAAGNLGAASIGQVITVDTAAPTVNAGASSPADNATGVSATGNLVLKLSELLDAGASDLGKVYLKEASGNTQVSATITTTAGGDLLIDPSSSLAYTTDYYVTWDAGAFVDAAGNSASPMGDATRYNFTTAPAPTPTPAEDQDGVSAAVENAVPGLVRADGSPGLAGDGNGDGLLDRLQTDVASAAFRSSQQPDAPPLYVTLVGGSDNGVPVKADTVVLSSFQQLEAPADKPANLDMPLGLIGFTAAVPQPGTSATFSLFIDGELAVNGYWKQNAAGSWVNLASAEYGGRMVVEGGKTRLDFTLADGGAFDDDGRADGVISDPGAPGWLSLPGGDSDGDQFPDALEAQHGLAVGTRDNDVFASSRLFAMQLYRDILGREADQAGLDYWQGRLDSGALSRAATASAFLDSAESQSGAGALARLYSGALGRLADNDGLHHWMTQLQSGDTLASVAGSFAASAEFANRYGALDDNAFIDLLYRNTLERQADVDGKAYWLNDLAGGKSRGETLLGFTESGEYRQLSDAEVTVTLTYLGLLGRSPEPSGHTYWLDRLTQGQDKTAVIKNFLTSTEYHDRFLPTAAEIALTGQALPETLAV